MEQVCCQHLKELLEAETDVIIKHLANHKWFNHIKDENEGIMDFIEKYGWIMREMYCHHTCPDRDQCTIKELPNKI